MGSGVAGLVSGVLVWLVTFPERLCPGQAADERPECATIDLLPRLSESTARLIIGIAAGVTALGAYFVWVKASSASTR